MTSKDRLAAALDRLGSVWDRVTDPDSDMSNAEFAAAILDADPTLVCPDPEAHALADAVRRLFDSDYGADFRIEPWWNEDDDEGGYLVTLTHTGTSAFGRTLPAAITEALRDDT